MFTRFGPVFVSFIAMTFAVNLPSSITPCKRSDPDLSNCVSKAMSDAVVAFKNGNEEMNIKTIDPLLVPELIMVQSKTNKNFLLSMTYKNLLMKGLSEGKFKNVKVDVSDTEIVIKGEALFPHLIMDADYEILGKMMLFNLNARDKTHMELIDQGGEFTIVLTPDDSEETEKYMVVKKAGFRLTPPKSVSFHFDNLVKGNKQLSEELNKVMEENLSVFLDIFKGSVNDFFSSLFNRAASKVFSSVPMNMAFPA